MRLLENRPLLLGLGLFLALLVDLFYGTLTPESAVRLQLSSLYASPSFTPKPAQSIWVYQIHENPKNPLAFDVLLDIEAEGKLKRVTYPITARPYRFFYAAPKVSVAELLKLPSQSEVVVPANPWVKNWRATVGWVLAFGMILGLALCILWMTKKSPCPVWERFALVLVPPFAFALSTHAFLFHWMIAYPVG